MPRDYRVMLNDGARRGIAVLVLSVPSAILVAIAAGARRGISFRSGVAVENIAGATKFAFDKTGTLAKVAVVVISLLHRRRAAST